MQAHHLAASKMHHLVESTREGGDLATSLELGMRALLAYATEKNPLGFAETLDSIFLSLKHLHQQHQFQPYWTLAGAMVKASVEIAKQSGINEALAIPQFNLAQYLEESGELVQAKEMYQRAVQAMTQFPPPAHRRPAVLAQMKLHLEICELTISGHQQTLANIEQLLAELALDKGIDADYNCKVWISGGYLRLAQYFKNLDVDLANKYLQQAREIIEHDERLLLRRQQLAAISANFKAINQK